MFALLVRIPSAWRRLSRPTCAESKENGALATAKHFPGHGETHVDSHLDLPTIESDREHIENVELPPFRAAIDAGVEHHHDRSSGRAGPRA